MFSLKSILLLYTVTVYCVISDESTNTVPKNDSNGNQIDTTNPVTINISMTNETTPKLPELPEPLSERKIMILGKTGTGKSTLANVLIGQSPFSDCSTMTEAELSELRTNSYLKNQSYYDVGACVKDLHNYKISNQQSKSVTMEVEANPLSDGTYPPFLGDETYGISLKCIDTPGLSDATSGSTQRDADSRHIYNINKFYNEDLKKTKKGVDAFVLVLKHTDRIEEKIVELLEILTRGFGVSFWDNCIIVMTFLKFKELDYEIVNDEERYRKFKDDILQDFAPTLTDAVHKIINRDFVYADKQAKDRYNIDFFKQRMVLIDSEVKIEQAKSKVKNVRNIDEFLDEQLPLFRRGTDNFLTLLNELHEHPYDIPMKDVKTRYEEEQLTKEENECLKKGKIFNKEETPGSKMRCRYKICKCYHGKLLETYDNTKKCPDDNFQRCVSCDSGYRLRDETDDQKICEKKPKINVTGGNNDDAFLLDDDLRNSDMKNVLDKISSKALIIVSLLLNALLLVYFCVKRKDKKDSSDSSSSFSNPASSVTITKPRVDSAYSSQSNLNKIQGKRI